MNFPLARDQQGNPLDLPEDAAFWRVRRHTGGRPSTVLGPDGESLFLPIATDRTELRAYGCNGSIRLEAVDSDYKPVHAPVAFVELGTTPDETAPRNATVDVPTVQPDLMRVSFESMTRTMEAMQRAQVERERALAQKERALTDAQVAMQRSHTELMVALLDRATSGKPQDPLAVIKQQFAIQRTLEEGTPQARNAGLLAAPAEADENTDSVTKWVGMLAPLVPHVTSAIAGAFAGDNPEKADAIRRNGDAIATVMGSVGAAASEAKRPSANPFASFASTSATDDDDGDGEDEDDDAEDRTRVPSRAIREVLANLDDGEAALFTQDLDALTDEEFARIEEAVQAHRTLADRVAWIRQLLNARDAEPSHQTDAAPVTTTVGAMRVPPELFPVLAQLTPDERVAGGQLLQALDIATLDALVARLIAMPHAQALNAIREAIANAQRRAASVAQRAVRSLLRADSEGAS